jgi:hypothetical protein
MSLDTRFNEEELFLLTNTPYIVGAAMVFSGSSGLGTVKEMFSNTKSFFDGAKKFPNNEIITAILPNMTDFDDVRAKTKEFKEKSKEFFKSKGIKSSEQMQDLAIEETKKVAELLSQKATKEETDEYKQWTMSIAENVAKAAKEGGFLGFGGEQISGGEKEFFTAVSEALGSDLKLS